MAAQASRRRPFALAFVAFAALGPLTLLVPGPVRTRATPVWPKWSSAGFLDGTWTADLGEHLTESSPVTVTARGLYAEALWLLGEETWRNTTWARAGWLYNDASLHRRALPEVSAARREVLGRIAAFCERHGVRLLAVPVPDKWRIHPEALPDDDGPGDDARARYPTILADLDAAGIERIDLAAAMTAWRRARPAVELYSPRDTHWNVVGAVRSSGLMAARLEALGWMEGIPPEPLVADPFATRQLEPDLVGTLGIREGGALAAELTEDRAFSGVHLVDADGNPAELDESAPDAGVAIAGDSFSARLGTALASALGRRVNSLGAIGARGPIHGLGVTLDAISRGAIEARVVVWCFVERSVDHPFCWLRAEPPLDEG